MADAADPLAPLENWLVQALAALDPSARRSLFREIGVEIRRRNRTRMQRETGPDGTPWPARKRDRNGRVRTKAKMLVGLRELRRLGVSATPAGVTIGYSGTTGRIAAVHQGGEVDRVMPGGPRVKYPSRPLLGLSPQDIDWLKYRIVTALKET